MTGRICDEIEPDRPVHVENELLRFSRAEDVAADDRWAFGPYALASRFSLVLMNCARPVMYASPLLDDIGLQIQTA